MMPVHEKRSRHFSFAALLPPLVSAQNIPQQIDAILARPALTNNTWTILIENANGSVQYYEKTPNTGRAPASNTKWSPLRRPLHSRDKFDAHLPGRRFQNEILSIFGSGNARLASFIAVKFKTNGY
jgi:hypothetical protein